MARLRAFWEKVRGSGANEEGAEAPAAFVLTPVTQPPPDLDAQQWFIRRRPDFGVGSRAETALNLPGEHAALRQQIEMADRYSGSGDYVTANKMLDDAERLIERQFDRLSDKPASYLAEAFKTLDAETLKNLIGRVDEETVQEIAARLELDDFQRVLVKVKGHVRGDAMIRSLPMNRVDELIDAKGVDPERIAGRAGHAGRDAERLKRRAVELVLLCPGVRPDLIEDMALCGDILADGREALRLLDPLNQILSGQPPTTEKGQQRGYDEHLLTAALREKEVDHHFPDVDSVPVGILSGETFLGMTAWGYTPKDPGAGLEHGEFTHRLQWNALMTRFEEDQGTAAEWQHTPFELYTMIGEIDEQGARGGEASAWGVMMDTGGSTLDADADRRDVERAKEGFARPDNVTRAFKVLSGEEEDNLLARIVTDRYNKRKEKALEQDENSRAINERLSRERDEVVQACRAGEADSRDRLDRFVQQNAAYINMATSDFDEHMGEMHCPRVNIKAAPNMRYDLYMEEYKLEKLQSPRYKLLDEAHPEDLLLIGQDEEDLTDEEKRGRVLELRARSRAKFNKQPVFSGKEQQELRRRISELAEAASVVDQRIDVDELYEEAAAIGSANGLAAAIDHVVHNHDLVAQIHGQWRKEAREVVRSLRKLQNRMRAAGDEENSRAADRLEEIATRLESPPNHETAEYLRSDPLVRNAEKRNAFGIEIEIRDKLLPVVE